ncbi:hypothetical protein [Chamaesiphon sp. VAR_48_metabat_403]|uniref:hypothetical protein n=1 Tax=Chamaesiphon sp. VAR_48_metabat_403 TaxID=2964700 RepID=UPI00286E8A35|nr:hypothetical protein [Chamaesiphon sp. VAR_48_metabat_403]
MMRNKLFIQIVLPVLLVSCSNPYKEVAQRKEIPRLEEKLAQQDKTNDSSSYVKVLDAIQTKCSESNRTSIAMMALNMGSMEKQYSNKSTSNLDSLKLLYFEANSFADTSNAERVNCLDVLTYWKQQHNQILKEENENTKQEEVMNLGK